MTTGIEGTASERVSVPAILADLIMLGQLHKLPDPVRMGATESNSIAGLDFVRREDFDAWCQALDATDTVMVQAHKDGWLANAYVFEKRGGWRIHFSAEYCDATTHTELPAETLTVLEDVANPPRLIAIVSEERAEDIRCELNGFIEHEYEVGTEVVNGIAVRVNTVVGTDNNIDAALAWAVKQAEVEEYATGLSVHGPRVTLVDTTVIAWTGKLWEFVAQDRS